VGPAWATERPVFGQLPANRARGVRSFCAMLKAGTGQPGGALHEHHHDGVTDLAVVPAPLRVRTGPHAPTDRFLSGAVRRRRGSTRGGAAYATGARRRLRDGPSQP